MSTADDNVLRPLPRRPFSLTNTPETTFPSRPSSPSSTDFHSSPHLAAANADEQTSPPSRTRSILNLTSSTLFGIYSPTGYAPDRDDTTPWGTGAETPLGGRSRRSSQPDTSGLGIDAGGWKERSQRRRSSVLDESAKRSRHGAAAAGRGNSRRRRGFREYWVPLVVKAVALGLVGVCYGLLISHLHDRQQIAPVKVEGIPHHSRAYLGFWGVVAVLLGLAMPWMDGLWESDGGYEEREEERRSGYTGRIGVSKKAGGRGGGGAPEWNDVVRSIGAFVGIAFAIRKLPWQSTLQLSLTLALSNPAIWYLLDRTPPGLVFSTTVALSGTALCLAINPNLIPAPSSAASMRPNPDELVAGIFSHESVGVATWIASVLFFSAVCFGNIGRRL